jgi:probable addiction module antidote protein
LRDRRFPERSADQPGASRAGAAARRLDELLARGRSAEFLATLRQLSKAHGGVAAIATKAGLSRPGLYRSLSPAGNPELGTITAVLDVMGLRFGVSAAGADRPEKKRKAAPRRRGRP